MWASNYAAQSSYALQSHLFVPRLQALGHKVTVFELSNGQRKPYQTEQGITVLSSAFDPLGNDAILDYCARMEIDATISLMDVWRFDPNIWKEVPFFPQTPIDHSPVPPGVLHALSAARKVIAMSQFGVTELKKCRIDPLYVPLAYNPAVWHPRDKQECRAKLGIPPEAFWVSFIGVNDSIPSRKGIPELLSAWQLFSPSHPDAVLYLHCGAHGNLPINGIGGVRIDHLMGVLGLDPERIKMVDAYEYRTGIKSEKLAEMVSASDAVILPSRGEGFGLPILEAQAAGIPVITTRCAAQEELLQAGWFIEGESEWSYQDSFWMRPGILSTVEALEHAYEQRNNPNLRQIAIEGVKDYEVDNVVQKYWRPALETIAEISLDSLKVESA